MLIFVLSNEVYVDPKCVTRMWYLFVEDVMNSGNSGPLWLLCTNKWVFGYFSYGYLRGGIVKSEKELQRSVHAREAWALCIRKRRDKPGRRWPLPEDGLSLLNCTSLFSYNVRVTTSIHHPLKYTPTQGRSRRLFFYMCSLRT